MARSDDAALQLFLDIGNNALEERCREKIVREFATRHGIDEQEVYEFLEKETFAKKYGVEIDVVCSAIQLEEVTWGDALMFGAFEWDVL